jgi:hypothetical protein
VAEVPTAATVRGEVLAPVGRSRVENVTVTAFPTSLDTRRCPSGADAGACTDVPVGILDEALGDEAFVPRSATAVAADGRFVLTEMDCGDCTPEAGALFDISLRPAEGSRMPWGIRSAVTVAENVELGSIRLSLPIIHRGVVAVVPTGAEAIPIRGALIRAYVLRDAAGQPIEDPETTPPCSAVAAELLEETRCIRSVVQVGETRSLEEGAFELVLPSSLE